MVRLDGRDIVNLLDEANYRVTHLQAALEASEAARADLADKLDDAQSNLAWARKCVEHIQMAPSCDDCEYFMIEARVLAKKMAAPSPADVMRRDWAEHEGGKS